MSKYADEMSSLWVRQWGGFLFCKDALHREGWESLAFQWIDVKLSQEH